MTYALLSGIASALGVVASAVFLRSFLRTHDRFFVLFSAAFVVLGCSQLALGLLNKPEANLPLAYAPRLISSILIMVAIVDKNRIVKKGGNRLRLVHSSNTQLPRRAVR